MSYLNDISIIVTADDLEDDGLHVKYYPEMKQKYCLMMGDLALWFTGYTDYKKFSLAVQSEFEKTMRKDLVGVK